MQPVTAQTVTTGFPRARLFSLAKTVVVFFRACSEKVTEVSRGIAFENAQRNRVRLMVAAPTRNAEIIFVWISVMFEETPNGQDIGHHPAQYSLKEFPSDVEKWSVTPAHRKGNIQLA